MKKIYRLLYSNKFVAMVMLLMQIITFVAMYMDFRLFKGFVRSFDCFECRTYNI